MCMDANEHIYKKSLGKSLTKTSGLAMNEVVGAFTNEPLGATFFRGSNPIDGVWATSDVVVTGACVMPAGYGVGDHRMFIIDFLTSSLVGKTPPQIVRASAHRVNTKIIKTTTKYTTEGERNITRHRIIERIGRAHETSTTKQQCKAKLDNIDQQTKEHMRGAEKRCRRIKSGRVPFPPESSRWIRRAQVYRSVLRYHAGKI